MKRSRQKQETDDMARKRVEVILGVRSGLMTAADAARKLGVSRKTYYKWEERALSAMVEAVSDRRCGRPLRAIDGQKEVMKKEIGGLQKALLLSEQRLLARETFLSDDPELVKLAEKALAKKKEREANEADTTEREDEG